MSKYSYEWEKLHVSVLILAAGTGTLRERLLDAHLSSLMRLRHEHNFPDNDLNEKFVDLMNELAPGGRADIALARWGEDDLKRIAEGVVSLCDSVARRKGEG